MDRLVMASWMFVVGALFGVLAGGALCVRYLRFDIAADGRRAGPNAWSGALAVRQFPALYREATHRAGILVEARKRRWAWRGAL
jgi:hypothetical protein